LQTEGACELAYYASELGRFRVGIFAQRGSYSVSFRVLPHPVRSLMALGLPPHLGQVVNLHDGLVLVTGPAGAGRSSTLAALVDAINEARATPIVTIENPIEYLHQHKRATVLQREIYRDVPSFGIAMRAALRQFAQVIFVSELREREILDLALEGSETGQLVLAPVRTINATRTLERLLGLVSVAEQPALRARLARNLRLIISQRLLPSRDGTGRVPLCEILIGNSKTRGQLERADFGGKTLSYAMREGRQDGMQCFEDALEGLLRSGIVSEEAAQRYAGDILESPLESAGSPGRSAGDLTRT
jgi:twitching motility protein PilT